MAKIYINVRNQKFVGEDNLTYDVLYTIERKLTGNMQLCGASINGELKRIDRTVPTEVDKVPRGAKRVPDDIAEKLYKKNSYYFGE